MPKPFSTLLWMGNAPWNPTGYGTQTDVFLPYLSQVCEQVVVFAYFGLQGGKLSIADNVLVLPASRQPYGQDMLAEHVMEYRPFATIGLIDLWVYSPDVLRASNYTTYCPIDHDPIPPAVANKLPHCANIWAMSKFGEAQMRRLGHRPYYVPHGINVDTFKPAPDRQALRRKFGIDDDTFFAAVVAANKGYPPRKNLDRVLKAWSLFIREHPASILHLHTEPSISHGGIDVVKVVEFYNIPSQNVRFVEKRDWQSGGYTPAWLNELYNAADVLVSPSAGEGFGIPVVEAQASGCPVIVTDFTAQSELGEAGYKIPLDPIDDILVTPQHGNWAWPKVSAIVDSLRWAHAHRGDETLRRRAFEFAQEYDVRHVFAAYMMPALHDMITRPPHMAMSEIKARAM